MKETNTSSCISQAGVKAPIEYLAHVKLVMWTRWAYGNGCASANCC